MDGWSILIRITSATIQTMTEDGTGIKHNLKSANGTYINCVKHLNQFSI
jgi:hypothetical protein